MPSHDAGGKTRLLWAAAAVLALVTPRAATAQDDSGPRLPIDILQGFTSQTAGVRPYLASLSVVPTYSFDPLRVGVHLSVDYENPGWDMRFGPRISSRVSTVFRDDIGFLLGAEATWTTSGDARLGAGVTFDVDGLVRVGAWGGWDEARDGGWFGLTLGADPTSWFGCVPSDIDPSQCADSGGTP